MKWITRLIQRISEIERSVAHVNLRMEAMIQDGVVTEEHPDSGGAVVDVDGITTKKIPLMIHAGTARDFVPLKKGERVTVFSPGGDMSRARIAPGGYSDGFEQPHNTAGECARVVGSTKIVQTEDGFILSAGGQTLELNASGLFHNGKNIGSTHKHGGVTPGSADTAAPT